MSLIAALLLGLGQRAEATRPVRVYEATVSAQTEASVQAQAALRQVLVRATGARDAANDPALAGLLAQAQQYVLGTRPAARGTSTHVLMFDGAAVERDIIAAGRSIWLSDRPLVLVILTGGPAAGVFESRRQVEGVLASVSDRRGQPIRVARPEAVGIAPAGDISVEVALDAARRMNADAVLVGYGDSVPGGGPWRWVLNASGISETWNGSLDEAINALADIMARNSAAYAALPEFAILVEVEGITALKDYARVSDLLGAANGVRSVQLAEASGTRATFSVVTRGGADVLQTGLGGDTHLERADPRAGGAIAYRYRP
ncbi:MAG: DUF2066 domain-containing protein [Pseudomonadota bacterium]